MPADVDTFEKASSKFLVSAAGQAIEKGEHLFYIMRIIKNQGQSVNSKFYYQYKKYKTYELQEEKYIADFIQE